MVQRKNEADKDSNEEEPHKTEKKTQTSRSNKHGRQEEKYQKQICSSQDQPWWVWADWCHADSNRKKIVDQRC